MSKLDNFPPVYWLSLPNSKERQESAINQFEKYGIKNHTMVFGYDAKENDLTNHSLVDGAFLHQMSSCDVACAISHLKMIKEWYYNSDTPYAMFFEDDINFEVVEYWNFTWDDVINNLPNKWNAIQMCMVREPQNLEDDVKLNYRVNLNWSGAAYLLSREYAKRLIDDYCNEENYTLFIKGDLNSVPYIENIIFFLGEPEVYTVPLFTEKVKLTSNFYPYYTNLTTKESNLKSEEHIRNWWIQNGKHKRVEEIMSSVTKARIINTLLKNINGKKYLEIGVSEGNTISQIKCEYKIGVDPESHSQPTYKLTSDQYFEICSEKFDVILIDGLHIHDQVYRDITNALNVLNPGGYVVCYDMLPTTELLQIVPYQGGNWTGDCWKAFVQLRQERDDLEMMTVDTHYGCSIITKGTQERLIINEPITYDAFARNKDTWMNIISVIDYLNRFEKNDLTQMIEKYILDNENPENNYALAVYYEGIGQYASAISYYLRTAERTNDKTLQYECLIRASICFDRQGTRNFTVKGLLQHAVSILPKRPEAYYHLSRFYERENKDGTWNDSYMIASIGEQVSDHNQPPLRTYVDYPGNYGILFQKAVSSWWCGLCEESRNIFLDLKNNYNLSSEFLDAINYNLEKMGVR